MTLETGLYEQLVNRLILEELSVLEGRGFGVERGEVDGAESHAILSRYLQKILSRTGALPEPPRFPPDERRLGTRTPHAGPFAERKRQAGNPPLARPYSDRNPAVSWVPSQKGLIWDAPHRQRWWVMLSVSVTFSEASSIRTGPRSS